MTKRRNPIFAVGTAALVLLVGGCDDKLGRSSAPGEREVPAQGPPPAAAQPMSKDCDMSGMDMSKMSAEEHQKMLDACARQRPTAP